MSVPKLSLSRRRLLQGMGIGAGALFLGGQAGIYRPSIGPERVTEDVRLALARGKMAGHRIVQKFGANSAVGTSYVPVTEGGIYRMPTTPVTLEAVSGSADDTAAGTGAQQISIIGLDSNWNEVEETIEMAGTSASAATSNSYLRLYRAYITRTGSYATASSGSHAGDITIRESGGGDTWTTISDTDFDRGQTTIACYTVPDKREGYVSSLYVHVDSNKAVDILVTQRPNANDVTAPFTGAAREVFNLVGLAGTTNLQPETPGGPFAGPNDIIVLAKVATGTAAVSVHFEVIEVEVD